MDARLAVLEGIRDLRNEMRTEINGLRSEMHGGSMRFRGGMHGGFKAMRHRQDADVRLIFGALIALALGLAGMMAKGFHWF
jgi:hypothetical protein